MSEGNSAISLSGTYKSSCTQVGGAAIANGNYEQTWAHYGVGGDAGLVTGNFACAGMSVSAARGTFHNVVVLNGSVLSTGTTDGDNPGKANSANVDTTAALTFSK